MQYALNGGTSHRGRQGRHLENLKVIIDRVVAQDEDFRRTREFEINGCRGVFRALDGLEIIEIIGADLSCASGFELSSAEGSETWILFLQLSGRSLLLQNQLRIPFESGDLLLAEPGAVFTRRRLEDCHEICVRLASATLAPRGRIASRPRFCLINGESGIGFVLTALIRSLLDTKTQFCEREEASIRDVLAHFIAEAYDAQLEDRSWRLTGERGDLRAKRNSSDQRWTRVRQTIEEMLPDPTLSPGMVARIHKMSTRHLHRLFNQAGTSFRGYVLSRRLEHCREDMTARQFSGQSLTEIAFRWGFCDSSHFSRCFKAAYGYTAREFRAREKIIPGRTFL